MIDPINQTHSLTIKQSADCQTRMRVSTKILISAGIGALVAIFMCLERRGWGDMPPMIVFFWALGFSISLVLLLVFGRVTFFKIERTLQHLPKSRKWRDPIAAAFVVSLIFWAGPLIASADYAAWIFYFPIVIFSSLIICLICTRSPILFGALAAICIEISITAHFVLFEWSHPHRSYQELWKIYRQEFSVGNLIIAWFFLFAITLLVSLPTHVLRRKQKQCEGPP